MTNLIIILITVSFVYVVFSAFQKKGEWKAGGHGWAFGGQLGAVLHLALGSKLEKSSGILNFLRNSARGDFTMSLLVLAAAVIKADREVVKSELDYVKKYLLSQFGREESERLILILRNMLSQELNIEAVGNQIGNHMSYPCKLQLIHVLFGIASADGKFHYSEVDVICRIAGYLGVLNTDFNFIRTMFIKTTNSAYYILEISPEASDEEVKKNYHRLALEYNPDRVLHLGEDILKATKFKFQILKAAYEQIMEERGIYVGDTATNST